MDIAPGESLYEDEVKVKSRLTLRPHQAPPSTEFSRQEYWSGVPFPSASDLPDPGMEPGCTALQAEALPSEPPGKHLL